MPAQKVTKLHTHGFTLALEGIGSLTDEQAEGLHARLPDATLSERDSLVRVSFDREASSFPKAVLSAIRGLEQCGFRVARIETDDLVGMADIASRTHRAREGVRLLAEGRRGPGKFPPPVQVVSGRLKLWRWPDVEHWFAQYEGRKAERRESERAAFLAAVNAVLETRRNVAYLPAADVRAVQQLVRDEELAAV